MCLYLNNKKLEPIFFLYMRYISKIIFKNPLVLLHIQMSSQRELSLEQHWVWDLYSHEIGPQARLGALYTLSYRGSFPEIVAWILFFLDGNKTGWKLQISSLLSSFSIPSGKTIQLIYPTRPARKGGKGLNKQQIRNHAVVSMPSLLCKTFIFNRSVWPQSILKRKRKPQHTLYMKI